MGAAVRGLAWEHKGQRSLRNGTNQVGRRSVRLRVGYSVDTVAPGPNRLKLAGIALRRTGPLRFRAHCHWPKPLPGQPLGMSRNLGVTPGGGQVAGALAV